MARWKRFCFLVAAAIRKEGLAARCEASGKRPDKAGARRAETRRARRLGAKSIGSRLIRSTATVSPIPKGLVANALWQNAPTWP